MLRIAVATLGIALLIGGAFSMMSHQPELTTWLLVVGGALTAGTVFERVIYKPLLSDRPGRGWTGTGERFVDPETGKTVDVFYNAASGERRYVVAEPGQATDR
jgi:hypothetical protein